MKKICLVLATLLILSVMNFPIVNAAASDELIVGISSSTGNLGNIFYNNEAKVMTFTYTNGNDVPIAAETEYQIYKLDINNTPQLYGEPIKMALNIAANSETEQAVNLEADDFGLYKVKATLSGDVKGIYETEFSKSVKSPNLNYSFGATAHLNGCTKEVIVNKLNLMENAGMGLVRTVFPWPGYESWSKENEFSLKTGNLDVVLKETTKRDLDLLPVLGKSHPLYVTEWDDENASVFLDIENIDKYQRYVTNLLNEPDFIAANVNKIEVVNEPDVVKYYKGMDISQDFTRKGEIIACIYKTAYDTIKNINSDIAVGVGSLSGNWYMDNVKEFTDSFLSEFGGKKYFDAFALHPYASMKYEIPETAVNKYNDYYRDLLSGKETGISTGNTYNFGDNELWHTEFGWWKTEDITEFMQGVYTIRQYAISLAHANNDKFYMYNLMNTGVEEANTEYNFGIVKNNGDAVPYAAKYAYLQFANMNMLTADKDKCEQVVNGVNNSYITRFTSQWNDTAVYMLWSTNASGSINYSIPKVSDKIIYYDILGNTIDESEVKNSDGTYKLTQVPFYAVTVTDLPNIDDQTGLPIDSVVVDAETNSVTLSGYLGEEGKTATIMVLKPDSNAGNPLNEDIVYIDETTTRRKGYYNFTFVDSEPFSGEYIIRYNIDGSDTGNQQTYTYSQSVTIPTIKILSGEAKIRSLADITTAKLKLCVDLPKPMEAMAICAQYKDGLLVAAELESMNNDKLEMMFDYKGSESVDKLKVFLWEPVGYVPIIQDYKVN